MIIYNVTINVVEEIHKDWLAWMKNKHIPDVMNTGYFLENKIAKVLTMQEDETGHTYAIQYTCTSMNALNEYQKKCGKKLQQEHANRYQGKFVAFRTILGIV